MVGQSGSMLSQGCPKNFFPEPHTQTCVHCHHLCDPIYDTPLECEKFCPDYRPPLASLTQDVQTTASFEIKQTLDTKITIFTSGAILMIGVMFVFVNIFHNLKTRRILKLCDKKKMEKLYPKHFDYQHKYHTLYGNGKLTWSSIQNNASKEKDVRTNRGADKRGPPKLSMINDKNIHHKHTAMVHRQQNTISNVINNESDKIQQHQTGLPSIHTRNIYSDVEMNNNIKTQIDGNVPTVYAHIQEDQSPVIRPWFFFKAHNNEIPRSITHQSKIRIQDQCEDEELSSLLPHDTSEPMPTHKDQGDLKEYTYEHNSESTSDLSLPISSSSRRSMYHNMESIDKNSGDEELSNHLPQDTLPKTRMQDQCNSSGYGSQDTDNPSPTVGTTVQSVGVCSVLNDLRSSGSDVNESLLSEPDHGTHSTMRPNAQTEIFLRSDSGDGVSHSETYIDIAESETWGKVRLLYTKIRDLMPKYPWILNCAVCNEYVEVDLDGRSVDADIAMERITDNIDKDLLNYLHFSSGAV